MKKTILLTFALLLSVSAYAAKSKVTNVAFEDKGQEGRVIISLDKAIDDYPELTVKGEVVQVAIPGSFVWPKIEKNFSLKNSFDSKLMAYQFNKDKVRVRAVLPNSLNVDPDKVSLVLKGNDIHITFPKVRTNRAIPTKVSRAPAIEAPKKANVESENYDESYLEKLLKEKEESIKVKKPVAKSAPVEANMTQDKVKVGLSANQKSKGSTFSMMPYVGKFTGFLALVLLLFYGVVSLLKKGAFKKGKLGFLNSTKVIEVLNTTYIAPKRSLLLIRAHKQVFLVGSSEKGLHMISEVEDVSGLFKTGEKELSGSNFDSNLDTANTSSKEFKLKDFLSAEEVDEVSDNENHALKAIESEMKAAKESTKVKFSDQIKNKVKGLKQLQ